MESTTMNHASPIIIEYSVTRHSFESKELPTSWLQFCILFKKEKLPVPFNQKGEAINLGNQWTNQKWTVGLDNKQRPLAIYYDYDKKKTMNICSNDSKHLMQNTVRLKYGITDIKELSKWTNHSIHVGMACLLQSQGKAGDYIQRALRWCSEK
jgi:hypothetical protein